jgi:hypothetical protein
MCPPPQAAGGGQKRRFLLAATLGRAWMPGSSRSRISAPGSRIIRHRDVPAAAGGGRRAKTTLFARRHAGPGMDARIQRYYLSSTL